MDNNIGRWPRDDARAGCQRWPPPSMTDHDLRYTSTRKGRSWRRLQSPSGGPAWGTNGSGPSSWPSKGFATGFEMYILFYKQVRLRRLRQWRFGPIPRGPVSLTPATPVWALSASPPCGCLADSARCFQCASDGPPSPFHKTFAVPWVDVTRFNAHGRPIAKRSTA